MNRVLFIAQKFINSIFINNSYLGRSVLQYVINFILANEYLLIGVSLLIIGFAIGIINRLVRSREV